MSSEVQKSVKRSTRYSTTKLQVQRSKSLAAKKEEGCNTYRQSRDQAIKCKARHNSNAEYRVNIEFLLGLGRENDKIPKKTDLRLLSASGLESRLL